MANHQWDKHWICHLVSLRRRRSSERASAHEIGSETQTVWALAGRAVRKGVIVQAKDTGGRTEVRGQDDANAWMRVCICVSFEYSTSVQCTKYRRGCCWPLPGYASVWRSGISGDRRRSSLQMQLQMQLQILDAVAGADCLRAVRERCGTRSVAMCCLCVLLCFVCLFGDALLANLHDTSSNDLAHRHWLPSEEAHE